MQQRVAVRDGALPEHAQVPEPEQQGLREASVGASCTKRLQLLEYQPFGEELGGELALSSHDWLKAAVLVQAAVGQSLAAVSPGAGLCAGLSVGLPLSRCRDLAEAAAGSLLPHAAQAGIYLASLAKAGKQRTCDHAGSCHEAAEERESGLQCGLGQLALSTD